jgi:hypothetical protein
MIQAIIDMILAGTQARRFSSPENIPPLSSLPTRTIAQKNEIIVIVIGIDTAVSNTIVIVIYGL